MSKIKKSKPINEDSEEEYEDIELLDNTETLFDNDMELNNEDDDENDDDIFTETNECLIDKTIEDDNEYFGNILDSEIQPEIEEVLVNKELRISPNRLTKYEMVRILGERTKQLTMGAKPMVKNYETLTYDKIAEEELKLNMIPFKIKRPLPNGKFEIWTLDELKKDHLLFLLEE